MVNIEDRIKLPLRFSIDQLKHDYHKLTTIDWIDHFVKRNYSGKWDVLPLRGKAGATHPVMMIYSDPTSTEFENTPFLKECPYFQEVLNTFQCPLNAVRLMRLTPGSEIKEHTDHLLDAGLESARLHIPIQTNGGVYFFLNKQRVVLEEGECWYLRLSDPHSVVNRGNRDRIHMVIDVMVNDWLRDILSSQQDGVPNTNPDILSFQTKNHLKVNSEPPAGKG